VESESAGIACLPSGNSRIVYSATLSRDDLHILRENNNSLATEKKTLVVQQRQEAFASRYTKLYLWACSMTGDPIEAEDLVQDCYVAFVSANTNTSIENLDGYLRRMLSNMLKSRRVREARHSIAELNEANEIASSISVIAEIEERERQDAIKRQLRRIYNYATRRNTVLGRTKAGKMFILRYYKNKSGSEVATLTGSTRGSVDQFVLMARQEIKRRFRISDGNRG